MCGGGHPWGFSGFALTNQTWTKCPALYYVVCYKSASDLIFMQVLKRNPSYKHEYSHHFRWTWVSVLVKTEMHKIWIPDIKKVFLYVTSCFCKITRIFINFLSLFEMKAVLIEGHIQVQTWGGRYL